MIGSLVAVLWTAILAYVVAGLVATAIIAIIVGGLIDHYTRRRERAAAEHAAADDVMAVADATLDPLTWAEKPDEPTVRADRALPPGHQPPQRTGGRPMSSAFMRDAAWCYDPDFCVNGPEPHPATDTCDELPYEDTP